MSAVLLIVVAHRNVEDSQSLGQDYYQPSSGKYAEKNITAKVLEPGLGNRYHGPTPKIIQLCDHKLLKMS